MGIPFARWGARPFIVHPIPYPEHVQDQMRDRVERKATQRAPVQNPIQTALQWRQMLTDDKTLSMAEIARNIGVSRTRVTQVMNLLALPQEVVSYLASLTSPDEFRMFSERRLRAILATGKRSAQLSAFHLIRRQSDCE